MTDTPHHPTRGARLPSDPQHREREALTAQTESRTVEAAEPEEPTTAQLAAAAATLDLLSVPTRLHLMWLLAHQPFDVGSLAERTGASVAAVSQHLAKLRLAGLVRARREGRRQIYTMDDPHMLVLVEQILDHIARDGTLAPDPPASSVAIEPRRF